MSPPSKVVVVLLLPPPVGGLVAAGLPLLVSVRGQSEINQ